MQRTFTYPAKSHLYYFEILEYVDKFLCVCQQQISKDFHDVEKFCPVKQKQNLHEPSGLQMN